MSGNSSPRDDPASFDSEALEQWVAETAEQKGVSKQELLDEILSSYWILEDLSGIITGVPDVETTDGTTASAEPTRSDRSDTPARSDRPGASETAADASDSTTPRRDVPAENRDPGVSELQREIHHLREAIYDLSPDGAVDDADDPIETDLADLETEFAELASELEDLASTVEDHRNRTELVMTRLRDHLVSVRDRTETIEDELDDAVDTADLERVREGADRSRRELEEWIEREFDNIEEILRHLLDRIDGADRRLGAAIESCRSDIDDLETDRSRRERLAALKREAITMGVDAASCEQCRQSIGLGLLEEPTCPNCDRPFTGLTRRGRFPFKKTELCTKPPRDGSTGPESSGSADDWNATDADDRVTGDDDRTT